MRRLLILLVSHLHHQLIVNLLLVLLLLSKLAVADRRADTAILVVALNRLEEALAVFRIRSDGGSRHGLAS